MDTLIKCEKVVTTPLLSHQTMWHAVYSAAMGIIREEQVYNYQLDKIERLANDTDF